MENLFRDLDAVPWSELSHAYGQASDVPGLIRALVSENHDDRQEALYQLLGNVWHQGTIYEASSYVVPFLVRMLRTPSTPDRSIVAMILAAIASGSPYLEVDASQNGTSRETWSEILAKEGKDFNQQVALEREWVNAAQSVVDPHLSLLYEFIDHEEPELRLTIALALGNYPNHAAQSLEALNNAYDVEVEEHIKEAIEGSRMRLQTDSEEN